MKVSVSITTYNHEPFVAQALDSVLIQETDFDYEVLVGEDDSSDRTREIVRTYKEKYPDRIRLFLNDRENVIYIDGRPTGRWNFINNLKHARGQYVALLEGDDYWTSPHKLQKQADFLDAHPACTLCFHPVRKVWVDENRQKLFAPTPRQAVYTLEDLLERNFVATCSVLFRGGLFDEFPNWFWDMPAGDLPLHVLNAQHGDIGCLDDVMAVHRIHSGGMWSPRQAADRLQGRITILETLRGHLGPAYEPRINRVLARLHIKRAYALALGGDWDAIPGYIWDVVAAKRVPRHMLPVAAMAALTELWRNADGTLDD